MTVTDIATWGTADHVRAALERQLEGALVEVPHDDDAPRWAFSEALRRSLMLRQKNPFDVVAIGMPDLLRYRDLVAGSEVTLRATNIDAYFIREDGSAEQYVPETE
ncbi:hypothetical protein OG205_21150 [Lentzea sp. NBC_00516]|uniref:hypothetical protein n=1 Tax=Lentzea sp. NBC_00516 TaxID=2903582 RepID=UPI002E821229|nr:hypothetical protein [Lentzea sp. NBC_00516]WUD29427.1 hypothetical protein OG205_21150 [Lentzea sp. NBC_00516]